MSIPSGAFVDRYAEALTDFLVSSDEADLERAYALGREAISQGLGVIDFAAIHTTALGSAAPSSSADLNDAVAGVSHRTWQFFSEALAPFEMALRGFREANLALKESTKTLEERVVARTRELAANEERFRLMFEASPLPMWTFDLDTLAFVSVNDAAIRHYGYSREEFAARTLADIRRPEDARTLREDLSKSALAGTRRHRKKDGSVVTMEITANDFEFEGRRLRLVLANDVTERQRVQEALRKTEEQLRQSQKMDAVGRLAGGVAHDFNNILSVILSYADLLISGLKPGEAIRDDITEIAKAGRRAADLTRQLLTFSRQQVMEPKVLDLNEVLTGMDKMLRRILGADVEFVSLPADRLGMVRADPGSIEQVIMNLVINARDAMPTGGKLTMETANVILDEEYARGHVGTIPGRHVMLAVTDTGMGIDRATQARIFEPFFTTKEKGKGTGLGLSTVFGIVQQSGGSIWVYSEPGKGTTFKVHLPCVDAEVDTAQSVQSLPTLRGSETILLVEDDDQVRVVARGILLRNGYTILDAQNPAEALLVSEKTQGAIDLLLSDVVMPQMSGPELAARLSQKRPAMRILCMSGYTDDSIVRHGVLEKHIAYLQKPITPETLTRKVREVLDAPSAASP